MQTLLLVNSVSHKYSLISQIFRRPKLLKYCAWYKQKTINLDSFVVSFKTIVATYLCQNFCILPSLNFHIVTATKKKITKKVCPKKSVFY